eukprot:1091346-Pyramimonas_sp.AAC.1
MRMVRATMRMVRATMRMLRATMRMLRATMRMVRATMRMLRATMRMVRATRRIGGRIEFSSAPILSTPSGNNDEYVAQANRGVHRLNRADALGPQPPELLT